MLASADSCVSRPEYCLHVPSFRRHGCYGTAVRQCSPGLKQRIVDELEPGASIPMVRGNAARMRTPTDCSSSTFRSRNSAGHRPIARGLQYRPATIHHLPGFSQAIRCPLHRGKPTTRRLPFSASPYGALLRRKVVSRKLRIHGAEFRGPTTIG